MMSIISLSLFSNFAYYIFTFNGSCKFVTFSVDLFDTFSGPTFDTFSGIVTFSIAFLTHLPALLHLAEMTHLELLQAWLFQPPEMYQVPSGFTQAHE